MSKRHYSWTILLGCCLLQGGSLGIIGTCSGLYTAPVTAYLQIPVTFFTLIRTLSMLLTAIVTPFVARAFRKSHFRLSINLAALVYGGSQLSMAFFTRSWQWFLAMPLQGAAAAFLIHLPVPLIVNNWFHKRAGTAISISAAFSGLMGMMMSLVLGKLLELYGWRMAYLVNGLASMAVILPASLFILRYKPEELGMVPYGYEKTVEMARSSTSAVKISIGLLGIPFILLALAEIPLQFTSALEVFLNMIGLSMGMAVFEAATLSTLSCAGNLTLKLILGPLSDRFGTHFVALAHMVLPIAGVTLLLINRTYLMWISAFLIGTIMAYITVTMPLVVHSFWQGEKYERVFSLLTSFGTLSACGTALLVSGLYDSTGSFKPAICICLVALLLGGIFIFLFFRITGKRKSNENNRVIETNH